MNDAIDHQRYRGPLRAVIFDWAGTTIDFGSLAPVRAVIEVFRMMDVPLTAAEARGPMGMSKRDHLRTLLASAEIADRWQKARGRLPCDADVGKLYQQFLPMQKQLLALHAELIPGSLQSVAWCQERGLKIGSTTGYTRELMDVLLPLAREQGFEPEATIVSDDVHAGRPAPWMCYECASLLNVFPPCSVVVVDDTTVGVEAGLNAGMWTVGVAQTGNLIGLSLDEFLTLDATAKSSLTAAAHSALETSGAHYIIDSVGELPTLLPQIDRRLQRGDRP